MVDVFRKSMCYNKIIILHRFFCMANSKLPTSYLRPFASLQYQGKSPGFLRNSVSTKRTDFSQQPGC